jgi:hypothetical protein
LVMVAGGPRANMRTEAKRAKDTAMPMAVYPKTLHPSPGGGTARGP